MVTDNQYIRSAILATAELHVNMYFNILFIVYFNNTSTTQVQYINYTSIKLRVI